MKGVASCENSRTAFIDNFFVRFKDSSQKRTGRCSTILQRQRTRSYPMATVATDEIEQVINHDLNLGKVTSMSRSGSSGWAIMHRATTDEGKRLFIKVSREDVSMFEGEVNGLSAMFKTQTIRVPEVYHCGSLESVKGSFIIMEALEMFPIFSQKQLGKHLAEMHMAEPVLPEAKRRMFGFSVDNTIGATSQPNGWMDDWVEFFRERRLRHQLLLTGDGGLINKGTKLCNRLDELFEDVKETIKPSLLHGDLWSGNVCGEAEKGEVVIFDPACYYGHHEAEFGMSWCMEFTAAFWEEYRKLIPKAPGFDRRKKLYQLYHYLNHYNLFGGGYYNMSNILITELLNSLK